MSPRKLIAVVAVAAMSFATPSFGDAQQGVNVGTQLAGSIVETVVGGIDEAKGEQAGLGYALTGNCTFAGLLTPNNRLQIAYGGHAEATGPQVPQLTYIRCTISNGDGQTAYSEFANGGPVSQTASTAGPWKVSPVTVCVEGFAVFGPTPVTIITLNKTCAAIIA